MRKNLFNKIYNEAQIEIIVRSEDMPVRGNYIVSGDDAYDKEQEDNVIAKMEWNEWAWCVVQVRATWNGLEASDYLGGCSYESEKQFREDGYFQDMRNQVIQQLTTTAETIAQSVNI